jgi:hypothetical protein
LFFSALFSPLFPPFLQSGMTQIASPDNSLLVLGRVLVYNNSDLSTACGLTKQIQLTLLSQK